jgi:hypothetical protein
MRVRRSFRLLTLSWLVTGLAACGGSSASTRPSGPNPMQTGGADARRPPDRSQPSGPQPYDEVITDEAVSDTGLFTVHRVDDTYYFEIPDSLRRRDMLLISRIARVPANLGGFIPAGYKAHEQVLRWERQNDRVLLRKYSFDAYAEDSLPIAQSVVNNNFAPILRSFDVEAIGPDSNTVVVDVTAFYSGDTPAISGLDAGQRRRYQVRRLDVDRSFINWARSYPLNVDIRHTLTFDAGEPPSDEDTGTISMEMHQSMVMLPRAPMRPRYADARVGYFSVDRINYGLDELKAAEQTFIRRWRLEPSDSIAYARGELVDPVKPIVYYIDPATPARWRPYVRQGIEDWQEAFETAGFSNAIIARDPPSPAEDPEWESGDVRYSVVRWAASTTRNAQGPSVSDPRTGEIIESDIVWYHNHMRSYRNRLMLETGAANPLARTLDMSDGLMGEAMRQVIAHEVGHALGLPHNMISSSAYPVDSLRSASFARRMGVAPSVMDYARQNYIAQPGDGLQAGDFIRQIGPYDHYVINWGYRALPQARTPEDERPMLNRWIVERADDPMYKYLPQGLGSMDPRAQTEDMGDDPIRASTFGIENLKRVAPQLIDWTSTDGEDYSDLAELYGELVGQWYRYVNHVAGIVGGVEVDLKSADQQGPVFDGVPRPRQEAALAFLMDQVFDAPLWLSEPDILARVGMDDGGFENLSRRQAGVLNSLMNPRRLTRMAEVEIVQPDDAYPLADFLDDLQTGIWSELPSARQVNPYRRALHRAYLERAESLMNEEPEANPFFGPAPDVSRSDIRPLIRSQLRQIQTQAQQATGRAADRVTRAHWEDVVARVDAVLESSAGR